MADTHDRLLEVTARIFAEAGYHGTTTRRIAQEAEVNEVTLFRHFGTKEALIREALSSANLRSRPMLDSAAPDPSGELERWALAAFHRFYQHRNLIRRLMGDSVERPEIAPTFCQDANEEYRQLARFLETLKSQGEVRADLDVLPASGMLVGALLSNALWRDLFPDVEPAEDTVRGYVSVLRRAAGLERKAKR
ncbi:MAG TPA: helix-turn-helix domain-containing protein [Gemmatimonadales bacterium]|nr:helix-turn-helix domain-containing protein [Gemmatimonadales bacterium]